jgi:maltose/moltooligosaccharide transporter
MHQKMDLIGKSTEASLPFDRYRCGTLVYTQAGLVVLFAWLLWGDFCFNLMETILPNVLPLMLHVENGSNVLVSMFMTTIPSIMNFIMNPIVSTASDRYRSSWGRRIPFLLAATPFVTLFLFLLGFSHPIGLYLHELLSKTSLSVSVSTVTLGTLCSLIVGFRFFELFVNTSFWYLFNDVVPQAFMGRFLGLFRFVGSLATSSFSFLLLPHATTNTALIFVIGAVLYGSSFLFMGFNVKEGSYPPPEPIPKKDSATWGLTKMFVMEFLGHRIYRLVALYAITVGLQTAIGVFSIFNVFSIGLTLADLGKIGGFAGLAVMVLAYPVGSFIDRFHPIRVTLLSHGGYCIGASVLLLFLFFKFSKVTVFWIYCLSVAATVPFGLAIAAAALPLCMRVFPKDKFGQFSAANAMCSCVGSIVGGVLAGTYLDWMKSFFKESDFYYRFVPIWTIFFVALGMGVMFLILREWKALGGDEHYVPPRSDLS